MRIDGKKMDRLYFDQKIVDQELKTNTKPFARVAEQDEIDLHIKANDLTTFFELAKNADTIRHEKVDRIKEQYEQGTYHVSGEQVVQKILEEKLYGATDH